MDAVYYEDEDTGKIYNAGLAKRVLPLIKPHWRGFLLCSALLLITSGFTLAGPILIKRVFDINLPQSDFNSLITTVLIYLSVQTGYLLVDYWLRVKLEIIGQEIMTELRQKLFGHITHLSISFFDKNPVGRLLSRVESDTEALRMLFTQAIVILLGDIVLFIGMFGVMFYVSPRLTGVAFIIIPPIMVLTWCFQKISFPRFLKARKRMADVCAFLTEYLQGMSIVQAFRQESQVIGQMREANRRKFREDIRAELSVVVFFNSIFFLETIGFVLVVWFGGRWVMGKFSADGSTSSILTIGTLIMFVEYIRRFFEPIHHLSEHLNIIQRAFAGAKRIFELLDTESEVADPIVSKEWESFQAGIEFRNVWFSYNHDEWVLKDINFFIPKGKCYALVGATGGGKTSLMSLLLRFYDPQKGSITVDGIDLRDLSQTKLRRRFGLVLQDIYLFPGTIEDNLKLEDRSIERSIVEQATKITNADSFISRLKAGLQTPLAERGQNLSTGERQLLSFARALVFDPEILILDEATSSVDPHTELLVQQALKRLLKDRTSLVIAHRLSTITEADCIMVVSEGSIVESGTHQELLANGGYYSYMYELQAQNGKNGR